VIWVVTRISLRPVSPVLFSLRPSSSPSCFSPSCSLRPVSLVLFLFRPVLSVLPSLRPVSSPSLFLSVLFFFLRPCFSPSCFSPSCFLLSACFSPSCFSPSCFLSVLFSLRPVSLRPVSLRLVSAILRLIVLTEVPSLSWFSSFGNFLLLLENLFQLDAVSVLARNALRSLGVRSNEVV